MKTYAMISFAVRVIVVVLAIAMGTGCATTPQQPGGDDDDVMVGSGSAKPDAGTMPDAPPADAPTTNGCAKFAQPTPTGMMWVCSALGSSQSFDCRNPLFTEAQGGCYAMCADGSTAGKVTKSDQNPNQPHQFMSEMAGTMISCQPTPL